MEAQPEEIIGQDISLLLWYVDEGYEERVALLNGKAEQVEGKVQLRRHSLLSPIPLSRKLLRGLKRVPENMRDIFRHSGFYLQITAKDLPFPEVEKNYHLPF